MPDEAMTFSFVQETAQLRLSPWKITIPAISSAAGHAQTSSA